MSDSQIEKLWNLHRRVLASLLQGKPYPEIRAANIDEINQLNYEQIMVKAGNLSFTNEGELVGAYPISPRPTNYIVEVDGIGKGFAMCAVDALGVAFTFQSSTKITARDMSTGNDFQIVVSPDMTTSPRYKMWMTYKTRCDPGEITALAQCPTINFHSIKPDADPDSNIVVMDDIESFKHGRERFHQETLINRIRKVVEQGQQLDVI